MEKNIEKPKEDTSVLVDKEGKDLIEPEIERLIILLFHRKEISEDFLNKLFSEDDNKRIEKRVFKNKDKYSYKQNFGESISDETYDVNNPNVFIHGVKKEGCAAYLVCKIKKDADYLVDKYAYKLIDDSLKEYNGEQYILFHNKEHYDFNKYLFSKEKMNELKNLYDTFKNIPNDVKKFLDDDIENRIKEIDFFINKIFKFADDNLETVVKKKKDIEDKVEIAKKFNSDFDKDFERDWKIALERNEKDDE